MKLKKKTIIWIGVIIAALIFLIVLFSILFSKKTKEQEILSINLREHKNLALHSHPSVEIEINGELQTIPPNVGIYNNGMRVIHTHDLSGRLHVESSYQHQFYLKDFFTIWGKTISDKCIFEYCSDSNHTLKFYLNGEESELKDAIPLRDGDRIKIVYS